MGSEPHTCPRCHGDREVPNPRAGRSQTCPTCQGEGVVWDRGASQESADRPTSDDVLDLTYRR